MTNQQKDFLHVLTQALHNSIETTDPVILQEASDQAVYTLMSTDKKAGQMISANIQQAWEQQKFENVLEGIPYVILKGTAAAIYYPEPIRRTLGDIDLMVSPENFSKAYCALKNAGYRSSDPADGTGRHAHFFKENMTIELHRRFAVLQTEDQERLLDKWIVDAIPNAVWVEDDPFRFPMLPDTLNGLVLLAHINQHMEEGLGIRQVIDWIMYVKHSLSDEVWPSFQEMTDQLGLTKLGKATARFGQKYLGMNEELTWCMDVQDSTVEELLDYFFECGNFGHKDPTNNTIAMVLSHGRGVGGFFRNLQQRGMENWKLLQRIPLLKPFAWVYQLGRYIKLGFRVGGIKTIQSNIEKSTKRNQLLDNLEATRLSFRKQKSKLEIKVLLKRRFKPLYYWLKKSVFQKPLYYIYDWHFLVIHKLMGKAKIDLADIRNVEENITFIYKSFSRQRLASRLYRNIKKYYPEARVIIADDSKEPLEIPDIKKDDIIIHLPFNSGLSKGLITALDQVKTPYTMRMDDDHLLTPHTNVHQQLAFLQKHNEVDLTGVQLSHRKPEEAAGNFRQIRMNKRLIIPAGTIIDGHEVIYKGPNVFLARTDSLKRVGYDPNIRMIDHHEFYYRAAGQIVCVQDPHSFILHCHNRFEKEYTQYRADIHEDAQYILKKHGAGYR